IRPSARRRDRRLHTATRLRLSRRPRRRRRFFTLVGGGRRLSTGEPKPKPQRPFGRGIWNWSKCPDADTRAGTKDRPSWVESCPLPSLSEVALLSHSPCSPSEREAGHEATRFHDFSRRRDAGDRRPQQHVTRVFCTVYGRVPPGT